MTTPPGVSGHAAAVPGADDAAWRRLNPRMLIIHPIYELLRSAPVLLGVVIAGGRSGSAWIWPLIIAATAMAVGVMRWLTTTYRTTSDQVMVCRGLFRRTVLAVPRDRVRTVDVAADVLHRLLGVTQVIVGTGRTGRRESGLTLDALTVAEAKRLADELLHQGVPEVGPAEVELARLRPAWLRYGPFMLSGPIALGVVSALLTPIMVETRLTPDRIGPVHAVRDQIGRLPLPLAAAEVLVAALVLAGAASAIGYTLSFCNLRLLRRSGGTLQVTHGLIANRTTTIEERRLHGAEVVEPLLVRLFRGARSNVIATGLRRGNGAERSGSMLLPPAPRSEVLRITGEVIRRPNALDAPLTGHGPAARRRRYTRALTVSALVIAAIAGGEWAGVLPRWATVASLPLLPVSALLAEDRFRGLGHALVDGALVAGHRSVMRRRWVLSYEGIIGWNVRRSFFQRRAGLASLIATTAAGRRRYPVQDMPLAEALRVADEAVPGLLTAFLIAPGEDRR